jgi:uracil-DNA glycosylase
MEETGNDVKIEASWKASLSDEFEKPYFRSLAAFVRSEYGSGRCFPPAGQIFSAFAECPFEAVKVVIIGQDPYHGHGQAHGLCFSVNDGISFPPSLRNIFTEIRDDLGKPVPVTGNLSRWARQGVLLLNATLTVSEGQAGSHQNKGWETFTDAVIRTVSDKKSHVVFMLWGGYARKKRGLIDAGKHCVLESGHPSPLSANKGHWFGNRHFSKANAYLESVGKEPVDW